MKVTQGKGNAARKERENIHWHKGGEGDVDCQL